MFEIREHELQAYLLANIEGLDRARAQEEAFEAVFLLRDWAASISNMTSDGTALNVRRGGMHLINDLLNFRGGVACVGAAMVFVEALRACGIPAAVYASGFTLPKGRYSHATTVFASQGKPYMMDAYLYYHFEDLEHNLLPLNQMLRMIRQKEYGQIKRIDGMATRTRVYKIGSVCKGEFAADAPPEERHGDLMIRHGLRMGLANFLLSDARIKLLKSVYGDRPIDEILLDCLFANPTVGPGLGQLGQELSEILEQSRNWRLNAEN